MFTLIVLHENVRQKKKKKNKHQAKGVIIATLTQPSSLTKDSFGDTITGPRELKDQLSITQNAWSMGFVI